MTHKLLMNTKLNWLSIVICESLILYLFILKGRTLKWPWQGRRQKPWLADTLQLQSNWQACSRHMGVKKKKTTTTKKLLNGLCLFTHEHKLTLVSQIPRSHTHTHTYVHTHKHWALNALPSKDKGHLSCATVERVYVLENRHAPQYGKNLLNQWMDKKP